MDVYSFLNTVSQISVAFVGFAAVVTALRSGGGSKLSAYQWLLIKVRIQVGFAVLFFSLGPSILRLSGLSDASVWKYASISLGIFFGRFLLFLSKMATAGACILNCARTTAELSIANEHQLSAGCRCDSGRNDWITHTDIECLYHRYRLASVYGGPCVLLYPHCPKR